MMPPGVEPIALFRTFAKNLAMAGGMEPWGRYQLGKNFSLGVREREIIIDRTTARCGCEYEWGVHVAFFAARVGLSEAEVAATVHGGADHPSWSPPERALIRLADELHDAARVSGALWGELRRLWNDEQLVELVVLAGFYHTISFVVNGLGVELEPGAPRFPLG